MNVHSHPAPKRSTSESRSVPVAGGGPPPYDEGMENRVIWLEEHAVKSDERFGRIETRLDRIDARLDQTATKADLEKAIADVIKWIVGMAIVMGATGITVMTFVLNNAVPKAPASPPVLQPIIIQMPANAVGAIAPPVVPPPPR